MSVYSELRTAVVSTGVVGERVHMRPAPPGETLPYVTFFTIAPPVPEIGGNAGESLGVVETLQVSVWHDNRSASMYEDSKTVIDALHGMAMTLDDSKVLGVRVVGASQVEDPDADIIQDAITVRIVRS